VDQFSIEIWPRFRLTETAVTGQYFMAQVNAKLSVIKNEIDDIKQYLDAIKQSELEAALQELNEIIRHLQFIKKDPERTYGTIVQIEDIRKVTRRNIVLYSNQIQVVIKRASKTDSENLITKNTDDLRQYMIQYRYAVYVYNLAQILKIYLNDITNVEELSMFRNEISMTVNSYKEQYDKMVIWVNWYLEETNSLNKMNIKQMFLTAGSAVFVGLLSRSFIAGEQTASQVNSLFEDSRKKKKEAYIARNDEYQTQMNDMDLINSSISSMDKYIELTGRKVELVSAEGEYFIKYLNDES
jgi:phage terminase small subunit